MTIFFIFTLMILSLTTGYTLRVFQVNKALRSAKKEHKAIESKPELGRLGKELTDLFDRIPDEHRPAMNIYDVCRAFEVKFGAGDLSSHFFKERYDDWDYATTYTFRGWTHAGCGELNPSDCPYAEIVELALQMKELIASVQEQNRVLELAEHQSGLSEARMLMAALDDSVHVVRSVTKEVSARVESYNG